jgi:diguanylate cyclase (GGDEF)-like protein/PAS domain S-box-containing protein
VAVLVASLYILAGAIAYAMLYSLVAPAGRRDAPALHAFAATCLFAALVATFAARMAEASSDAQFLRALKSNLDCLVLTALAYSVFIARYARLNARASRTAFAAYALVCAALIAVNEMRPYGLQYARFNGITRLPLPWHESIVTGLGRSGAWTYLTIAAVEGVVPYALIVLLGLYRRTRDRSALWMLAALAILVPFAVEGALVRLSILHGFAAGPVGILIVVVVTGATLSQETKRKLLDSEERFRVLFEHSPFAMVVVEPGSGRILEANDVALELSGYDAGQLARKTLRELTVPEETSEAMARFAELSAGRVDQLRSERRFVHKDGRILITRFAVSTLKDSAGEVSRLICCFSDVTERKLADDRLRESEMRLRTLIEQSPLAISFSRDGITLEVNAHYLSMFGYASADEVSGTPLLQRIAPSHRAEMQDLIERRRGGLPAPTSYETVGLRRDGSEFPLFVSTKRIELADGSLTMSFLMDFTERKQAEERIRHLAFFDQLTLLPNRELLQDRVNRALSTSARDDRYGALLLLNLDNFKSVNDTVGHAAGDALLQQAAARLSAEVRAGDTLARGDGDEFILLLEDLAAQPLAAAAQAKALGLKMMHAVSGSYALSEGTTHVSCSVGATILAGHRQTTEDLIKQANIALHQAKKSGRNALRFFDPRMQESVSARAALEGELRNALAASQLTLYYQLQVDENGRELGAEALLRWNHPERGLVSPGEFIALAEETHLIVPIGEWVMDAACARLAAWRRNARTRELSIAVNVSSLQFQQPEFAVQVLGCIRRHGIDPHKLKLELTETLLQGDLDRTVSTMNLLKAQGVQFALDDFGTGYSSLHYLKQLPLDQLKIDKSFVHDIASDANDRAIVSTIVAIAGHLALDVMAEGVETQDQLEVLRECGCTRYQGYLFGRPQAPERLFETEDALAS